MKLILIITLSIFFFQTKTSNAENHHSLCYEINDPWEKFNRASFAFNDALDSALLRPAIAVYLGIMPKWAEERVHNLFDYAKTPITLINNILQKDTKRTPITIGRMITNFFLGFGGFIDFASKFDDMDEAPQTFDDTLAYYNISYGHYFVIPLLGPSTTRGVLGKAVDSVTNPINYALGVGGEPLHSLYYTASSNIDTRIQHNELITATKATSVDYYSKVRSMYIQYISKRNIHCASVAPSSNNFGSSKANIFLAEDIDNTESQDTQDNEVQ